MAVAITDLGAAVEDGAQQPLREQLLDGLADTQGELKYGGTPFAHRRSFPTGASTRCYVASSLAGSPALRRSRPEHLRSDHPRQGVLRVPEAVRRLLTKPRPLCGRARHPTEAWPRDRPCHVRLQDKPGRSRGGRRREDGPHQRRAQESARHRRALGQSRQRASQLRRQWPARGRTGGHRDRARRRVRSARSRRADCRSSLGKVKWILRALSQILKSPDKAPLSAATYFAVDLEEPCVHP